MFRPQSESDIEQLIRIDGPHHACFLMRNNNGVAVDKTGRAVRFGLMNESKKQAELLKSSDEIGITTIIVTQEMVGRAIGIFTAVEVKAPDWNPAKKLDKHEQAQKNFIDLVRARGGFAGFANSLDSFRKILGK